MDDWHASAHRCRGALGGGQGLPLPAQNCDATRFPCCFCLNTGLYWGLCCAGGFTPPQMSPACCRRCSLLHCPSSHEEAHCCAGVCWEVPAGWGALEPPSAALHPCASLRLVAAGSRVPPAPGGQGGCAGVAASLGCRLLPWGCCRCSRGRWSIAHGSG